jgi:hypothetical protein
MSRADLDPDLAIALQAWSVPSGRSRSWTSTPPRRGAGQLPPPAPAAAELEEPALFDPALFPTPPKQGGRP